MKLFIKFMLFLLVLAVGAPFLLKDKEGRPLLALEDLRMPQLGTPPVPDEVSEVVSGVQRKLKDLGGQLRGEAENAAGTVVYKWRDAMGEWQFSDAPPPGVPSERIVLQAKDVNVVQAWKSEASGEERDDVQRLASPLARARAVEQQMENRPRRLEETLESQLSSR